MGKNKKFMAVEWVEQLRISDPYEWGGVVSRRGNDEIGLFGGEVLGDDDYGELVERVAEAIFGVIEPEGRWGLEVSHHKHQVEYMNVAHSAVLSLGIERNFDEHEGSLLWAHLLPEEETGPEARLVLMEACLAAAEQKALSGDKAWIRLHYVEMRTTLPQLMARGCIQDLQQLGVIVDHHWDAAHEEMFIHRREPASLNTHEPDVVDLVAKKERLGSDFRPMTRSGSKIRGLRPDAPFPEDRKDQNTRD